MIDDAMKRISEIFGGSNRIQVWSRISQFFILMQVISKCVYNISNFWLFIFCLGTLNEGLTSAVKQ